MHSNIITGYVELGPRNSYLKEDWRGFNSTSEAYFSLGEGFSSTFKGSTLAREGEIY